MKLLQRRRVRALIMVSGILYTLVFIACSLAAYIDPTKFRFFTYASLAFPIVFIGYILMLICMLFLFRKYSWIFFLMLPIAFKSASSVFSLHLPKEFSYTKNPGHLRVLSWNVNGLLYPLINEPDFDKKQKEMMDFMRKANADVLCFQDFTEAAWAIGKPNIAFIRDSLHYPYHYFSDDFGTYGTIIFSRLPILDSGRFVYPGKGSRTESLAYATVPFQKDTIRIYNTHLRSMFLHTDSLNTTNVGYLDFIKEDTGFLFHSDRLARLGHYDTIHVTQARFIKRELEKTKMPYFFCADLNSVPSSYVYQHIRKGLNDAFLQKSYGLGGTYHRYTFTLRIDVVLMSPRLHAIQYYSPRPDLSDHYPIVTDIELRN